MSTSPIGGSGSSTQSGAPNDALRDLDLDEFLKLMITELQNQDPLDPMKNSEILEQISQIREISATTQLSSTLDAVLLGQNIASASGLIGKTIKGLTADGTPVEGVVDRVSVVDGVPMLHVKEHTVSLKNVGEIVGEVSADAKTTI